ncbi:MAG: acyl-CoA desaturase [Actinomycetota bacterium]|nr:acyl-CoA desaturase [Actinomycetota bacterium]
MTPIAVLVMLTAVAMVIGLLRNRLPWNVVRAGYILGFGTPLLALAYAVWQLWNQWVGWAELVLLAACYLLTGMGMTMGWHRYLSHHSFDTGPAVKAVILVLGAMALPARPLDFAAYHLQHHAYADRDGDPHSPLDGLLHAHLGWTFGRLRPDRERYCRHLLGDRVVGFVDRTSLQWFGIGLLLPAAIDGWKGFLWGGLVRMAIQNHATFAVNSIGHAFGSRPFATRDRSRNNLLIAIWGLGEGWHNNHHAFPSAASHGIGWRQPDVTAMVIRSLERVGLVWNVRRTPEEAVARRRAPALVDS